MESNIDKKEETPQNGYVIQLYQYARRYRYNYNGSIKYFNYLNKLNNLNNALEYSSSYIVFGDFDLLEILPVDSFRKYHDVSKLAKEYLGRRQSVLLYCINPNEVPYNIQYEFEKKRWIEVKQSSIQKRFFCLSLLSITNEVRSRADISVLLPQIRNKILEIVRKLNEGLDEREKLTCEVYGALNATEIGIVWLCNQYVDVLLIIDYLKHMKFYCDSGNSESISLFLASNTTIATKLEEDFNKIIGVQKGTLLSLDEVKGTASVQISFHDKLEERENVEQLINDIISNTPSHEIFYSSGEYDLVIQIPASNALKKLQKNQVLNNFKRTKEGQIEEELRPILKNNIQLMMNKICNNENLERALKESCFVLEYNSSGSDLPHLKEFKYESWKELLNFTLPEVKEKYKYNDENFPPRKNNYEYYMNIRKDMYKMILPSAGLIDILDLMYADYLSTIANAYNETWVADFHFQFKAVLHAISLWLKYQKESNSQNERETDEQWKMFRDLTNAFKQQVYHLSQSSRMVLEIPRCHFRMTGQYDLLIHTYYGFAKIIIETIYLIQEKEHQSELVPLITVNTVPQVNSELYFEYGNNDELRAINLNIPASIIFDPQRGLRYLSHELFHYAAPQSREKRNYFMGCFAISESFKMQFIHIFNQMMYISIDGTVDEELKKFLVMDVDNSGLSQLARYLFFTNYTIENDVLIQEDYWLNKEIIYFIQQNTKKWSYLVGSSEDSICAEYQRKLLMFCQGEVSNELFKELCEHLMKCVYRKIINIFYKLQIKKLYENISRITRLKEWLPLEVFRKLFDRFQYCIINKEYRELQFSGLRADYADDENIGRKWHASWDAVREACSDIGMVSLTSMGLDDYLLFCIQAWKDYNCNKLDVSKLENQQWLRCALVFEYFLNNEDSDWKEKERFKHSFVKKYQCFYASKKDLKAGSFHTQENMALEWWKYFQCKHDEYFVIDNGFNFLTYYTPVFAEVLADFDIKKKIKILTNNPYRDRLSMICNNIKEHVYAKYDLLLESYFFNNIDNYYDQRFWHDLYVAQYFQVQKTFQELAALNEEVQEKHLETNSWIPEMSWIPKTQKQESTVISIEPTWEIHVRSLEELLFYLQVCEEKIQKGNKKEPVWFRGQSNESFKLIPSIMRYYDFKKKDEYRSLREYQQYEFEEFKHYADGMPEIPSGVRFTLSDYIALMQHYSVATTLLDWSENAFSALYFALENYFEEKGSLNNVSLYLLDPKGYNCLCRKKSKKELDNIKKELNETKKERALSQYEKFAWWIIKHIPNPKKWIGSIIPNLSTKPNAEQFASYLLGDIKFDHQFEEWSKSLNDPNHKKHYECFRNKVFDLYPPLAVRTSRLNTRIRMQSGCFVAFNLYTQPNVSEYGEGINNHAFDYISLEEIQKQILHDIPIEKKSESVFLYKITIDVCCCETIMGWLRGMGINRSSVYPELEQLKNRI